MLGKPTLFKIEKIVIENKSVKTFWVSPFKKINYEYPKPGQYVMLWLPELAVKEPEFNEETFPILDQIPMSISDFKDNKIAISVKKIGATTNELHKYQTDRYVGITGPLGEPFKIQGKRALIVAGGMGIAPLHFLIKTMKKHNIKIDLLFGIKTDEEKLLIDKIRPYCKSVNITSDDGSCGCKGLVTDLLQETFNDHDHIYSCGPEKMMKCVLDFSIEKNVKAQFSLERFMHCGIGVCGFCSLDGFLVCKDGPVFNSETLKNIRQFGKIRRKASGLLEKI